MAPPDEGIDEQKPSVEKNIANPFVAFRRFADDQASNLLSGFFNLSSKFRFSTSFPDSVLKDYRAWLQQARAIEERLDREAGETGRMLDMYEKALIQKDNQEASQDGDESSRCPYSPSRWEERQCAFSESRIHLPHPTLFAPALGRHFSSPPMAYLLYSPYSPLQLEQHQALRDKGIPWSEAFEDLLAVQCGQDMISECGQQDMLDSFRWLRRMYGVTDHKEEEDQRSTLASLHKPIYASAGITRERDLYRDEIPGGECPTHKVHTEQSNDDEEATELTLYELLCLGQGLLPSGDSSQESQSESQLESPAELQSDSHSHSRSFAHLQHGSTPLNEDGNKPSILSTLTTIERTTLEDGSVRTKVVLKKRFSDGREKSSETMHTQNAIPKPQHQPPTKAFNDQANGQTISERVNEKQKSRGWFWT